MDNAISKGNQFYRNEKSDTSITSYTHARGTVGSIASNDNISKSGEDVKYSKGLNSKDLTESSFKTLSNDYNIKDPKLRELYDEMIDDIKTSGMDDIFKKINSPMIVFIKRSDILTTKYLSSYSWNFETTIQPNGIACISTSMAMALKYLHNSKNQYYFFIIEEHQYFS